MNRTILLVEDDANDVFFMKRALKLAGVLNPLQVASDGQNAIDYLEGDGEFSDRDRFPLPAIVFLDLNLPKVPGVEVLRRMRKRPELKAVIFFVLSSSALQTDTGVVALLGANSYFVKPSLPMKLPALVVEMMNCWRELDRDGPTIGTRLPPGGDRGDPQAGANAWMATT